MTGLSSSYTCVLTVTNSYYRAILNLYMPYTSRDEITTAIEDCVKVGLTHRIDPDTYVSRFLHILNSWITYCNRYFTQERIEKHLMTTTRGSPPLDILIRTSGVRRLSDFLLWQVRSSPQAVQSLSTTSNAFLVLREHANTIFFQVLARLQPLGLYTHHIRLPT